jgi:hypothetical protein
VGATCGVNYYKNFNDSLICVQYIHISLENTTYIGVAGEVFRGESDIGLGQYFINTERIQLFDMQYYDTDGYCFMLKRPPTDANWGAIVKPFEKFIWISIACSTVASTAFMILLNWNSRVHDTDPVASVLNIIAAGLGQSFQSMARSVS